MTTRVLCRSTYILSALAVLAGGCVAERPDGTEREYQASSTGRSLQVVPETTTVTTDTERALVLTARLSSTPTAFSGPVRVQFEIVSGPNDRDGNSPVTPDITCSVQIGDTSCEAVYVGGGSGTDLIRAWIDEDDDPLTTEADATEGRNAGAGDCTAGDPAGACSDSGTPGSVAEPDVTDVVEVVWEFAAGGLGQPCRGGTDCDSGLGCQAGVCVPCGPSGAPCCAGNACDAGAACQPTSNTCVPCGGDGELCCEPPTGCTGSGSECVGGTCVGCGRIGQRCCAGPTPCSEWSSACSEAACTPCGGMGERCCDAGRACNTGSQCDPATGFCGEGESSGDFRINHVPPNLALAGQDLHLQVRTSPVSLGCTGASVTITHAGGSKQATLSSYGLYEVVIPGVDIVAPSFSFRIDATRECRNIPFGGVTYFESAYLDGLAVRVR